LQDRLVAFDQKDRARIDTKQPPHVFQQFVAGDIHGAAIAVEPRPADGLARLRQRVQHLGKRIDGRQRTGFTHREF
jgi:hypothetical protein